MSRCLLPVDEVARCIQRGDTLVLAAETRLLDQLPVGSWIGGTVPRLVAEDGTTATGLIHVTRIPADVERIGVRVYDAQSVPDIYADLAGTSLGVTVIPANSSTHLEFALRGPGYREFAVRPLVGWISGIPLDNTSEQSPAAYSGTDGRRFDDGAVVLQVTLPPGQVPEVRVVNVFQQGSGPTITFPTDGFDVGTAFVDGVETSLARYVRQEGLDTRLPLVADFYGQMVNVSFRVVDTEHEIVSFYSPVFAGLPYRLARPVSRHAHERLRRIPADLGTDVLFACNCILNHFYAAPEDRRAQGSTGPLTFGEVAYQLLNQTTVYLTRQDVRTRRS